MISLRAVQSHTSLLLAIEAVFASGNTVLGIDVVKYARSKLVPVLIAAGISVILCGVFSFFR